MTLKEVKKGDFFTLKDIKYPKENQVYVKSDYDRSTKKYICYAFNDINKFRSIKGDKEVFTDFTF